MARRKKGERRSREEIIAAMIEEAKARIGEGKGMGGTIFVKPDRAIRKQDNLDPTEHQAPLFQWIANEGFVPFEETLGMHWGILGGLFTRGLVQWTTRGAVFGLAPRERGF